MEMYGSNDIVNERVSINRSGDSILPRNKYEIIIHTDDHTPAHFHYKSKDGKFHIKVAIETLDIIYSYPRKGTNKKDLLTWIGIRTEKEALEEWLSAKIVSYKEETNYDKLVFSWNECHKNNLINKNIINPWK